MLQQLEPAKQVITNFHAFKLRERMEISKGGRLLLQGRQAEALKTLETEGQMIQRVMPGLMGIMVSMTSPSLLSRQTSPG
jgi:type III restriction enzyme